MLHFVPFTFFMQHLFAFNFCIFIFQQISSYLFCFGGPRQHFFRAVFSVELVGCSVRPWFHAGARGGGVALHRVRNGEGGDHEEIHFPYTSGKGFYPPKTDNRCSQPLVCSYCFRDSFLKQGWGEGQRVGEKAKGTKFPLLVDVLGVPSCPNYSLVSIGPWHGVGSHQRFFHLCLSQPGEPEKRAKRGNCC